MGQSSNREATIFFLCRVNEKREKFMWEKEQTELAILYHGDIKQSGTFFSHNR